MVHEEDLTQSKKDTENESFSLFEFLEDILMTGARIPVGFPTLHLLPVAEAYTSMSVGPTVAPGTYGLDPEKGYLQFLENEKVKKLTRKTLK